MDGSWEGSGVKRTDSNSKSNTGPLHQTKLN